MSHIHCSLCFSSSSLRIMPPTNSRRCGRPRNTETNEQPNGGENLMGEFLNAIRGFVQEQTQAHLNVQQPKHAPTSKATSEVVEQFRRYNPPRFNGRDGPEVAEEWLSELDRLFTHIDCTDKQKVACAVFQFTEDAGHWWKSFYRSLTEDDIPLLTWNTFQKVVMEKYCSSSFLEKKEAEFYGLKQEGLTIEEYERKFHQLSGYAPHLVGTEDKMMARFMKGRIL